MGVGLDFCVFFLSIYIYIYIYILVYIYSFIGAGLYVAN